MKRLAAVAVQVLVLVAISQVGHAVAAGLALPLPGNLLGMLLLLALLGTGALPLAWIERSTGLLLRHLAFFFVPITVGLMGFADLLREDGLVILGILLVSAGLGLCAAGLSSQRLRSGRSGEGP